MDPETRQFLEAFRDEFTRRLDRLEEKVDANARGIEANARGIEANARGIEANAQGIHQSRILIEDNASRIDLVAEGVTNCNERIDRLDQKMERRFAEQGAMIGTIIDAVSNLRDDHERRVTALERAAS